MAKVILEFDSHEDAEELENCMNGGRYKSQLEDIWGVVFRGRYKHGYDNPRLNELIESSPEVNEAMDILEKLYQEVVGDK